jgi:hypothetical protein
MNLDIRKPIGSLFTLLGGMIFIYGLISSREIYQRSLGININLLWGAVLLVFGAVMLWLSYRGAHKAGQAPGASARPGPAVEGGAHGGAR